MKKYIMPLEAKYSKNRHSQLDWESFLRFLQQILDKFFRYTKNFLGMTPKYTISVVLFSIVGFLVSCKPNQPEKNVENVTEVPADSSTTTFVETTNDVKNDVFSQFNRLRLALASQNPKLITTFFDFPLTDNQAIGLEEVLKFTTTSKIVGDITLQKDFENNIAAIFDKKVIKALGEISIEELKEKNIAQSKVFHLPNDNADYSVYVYTDEAEGNLDISVNATYPPSEDNEDALESAAIYNFKKDSNDKLKFKQVLMAG